jgi:hypothetical protein
MNEGRCEPISLDKLCGIAAEKPMIPEEWLKRFRLSLLVHRDSLLLTTIARCPHVVV